MSDWKSTSNTSIGNNTNFVSWEGLICEGGSCSTITCEQSECPQLNTLLPSGYGLLNFNITYQKCNDCIMTGFITKTDNTTMSFIISYGIITSSDLYVKGATPFTCNNFNSGNFYYSVEYNDGSHVTPIEWRIYKDMTTIDVHPQITYSIASLLPISGVPGSPISGVNPGLPLTPVNPPLEPITPVLPTVPISIPSINASAQSTPDTEDILIIRFEVFDNIKYTNCGICPQENCYKCNDVATGPCTGEKTTHTPVSSVFQRYYPNVASVLQGTGCTITSKVNSLIAQGYNVSVGNIIFYSMLKYILAKLLWGDFCMDYLLNKCNQKFFDDLRNSRFCLFMEPFEQQQFIGYNNFFIWDNKPQVCNKPCVNQPDTKETCYIKYSNESFDSGRNTNNNNHCDRNVKHKQTYKKCSEPLSESYKKSDLCLSSSESSSCDSDSFSSSSETESSINCSSKISTGSSIGCSSEIFDTSNLSV